MISSESVQWDIPHKTDAKNTLEKLLWSAALRLSKTGKLQENESYKKIISVSIILGRG